MSDAQYAASYKNNPGVIAPAAGASAGSGGGLAVGGAITCGGSVCGSATYHEESIREDSVANGVFLGLARGLMSIGESVVNDVAGSIRNVNPTGGTMNCVNCAIATDATLAGRPASALPGSATSIGVLEQQLVGSS